MKIGIANERSTGDKNKDIVSALDGFGYEIYNFGVKKTTGDEEDLTYIDTGFLTALLLNTKRVDFIIGGCGTGQGWMLSANKYPGVFCGYVASPMDAWLFRRINNGNCISLVLNQGYGWSSDVNLKFIFEKLFTTEAGGGYPVEKKTVQQGLGEQLNRVSNGIASFPAIVKTMDNAIAKKVFDLPGLWDFLDVDGLEDKALKNALLEKKNSL